MNTLTRLPVARTDRARRAPRATDRARGSQVSNPSTPTARARDALQRACRASRIHQNPPIRPTARSRARARRPRPPTRAFAPRSTIAAAPSACRPPPPSRARTRPPHRRAFARSKYIPSNDAIARRTSRRRERRDARECRAAPRVGRPPAPTPRAKKRAAADRPYSPSSRPMCARGRGKAPEGTRDESRFVASTGPFVQTSERSRPRRPPDARGRARTRRAGERRVARAMGACGSRCGIAATTRADDGDAPRRRRARDASPRRSAAAR